MEERRFDDLTRALGRGASRRQVLKGLAAGLIGGLLGVRYGSGQPASVAAAGQVCSSANLQQCYNTAKQKRDGTVQTLCGGSEAVQGRGQQVLQVVDAICQLQVDRIYFNDLESCDRKQCPHGGTCINDHCCEGDHCCDPGVQCGGTSAFEPPEFCCAQGQSCCHDKCCDADRTCCTQVDPGLPFGLRAPSFNYTCADLTDDSNNCGACGHQCRNGQICHDSACVCPDGTHTCAGTFNTVCCKPNERCGSANIFGFEVCEPICNPCEIYDPNDSDTPCKPVECDVCQQCDGSTGQCVNQSNGVACGSGLVCCGGQCQSSSEQCNGNGKGGVTCPECQQDDGNGNCVAADDGASCSTCGVCSSGTCVADSNRTCPTCQTCSAHGACVDVTDGTSCGDNQVCCTGQCKTGTSCDCLDGPNQHQCPSDVNGNQLCCHNALPCCAQPGGAAQCGETNGVCCDVGTQISCGSATTVCCDYATEDCSSPDGGATGQCCPKGQRVIANGSCCASDSICGQAGSEICCSASDVCSYIDNTLNVVCCPQGQMAVTDGSCCATDQVCATNTSSVCCASGLQCAHDALDQVGVCCTSQAAASDGTCCTEDQTSVLCDDNVSVCCSGDDDDACCVDHGGAK